jgi:hypothetical protein
MIFALYPLAINLLKNVIDMSEQNKPNIKVTLLKYLSEIVIIFLGISMSFWFDEWRNNRKDRETEQIILRGVRENLVRDTLNLRYMMPYGERIINCSNKLLALKDEKEIKDSLNTYLDMALTSMYFNATQTTYEEMKQTGRTSLIQDDTLRKAIISYYSGYIGYCNEWTASGKEHTEKQLMPEMTNYFSVVEDSVRPIPIAQKIEALKIRKLRNILLVNILCKKGTLDAYEQTLNRTKKIIGRIDKVLKK